MLAIQSVWAWAVPVTVSKAPVEGFVSSGDCFESARRGGSFDKPQRALALTYVTGLTPYAPTRVAFNIAPTVGEYFVFPSLTTTGPCEIMVLEGIPGGPMDCWDDVKTPDQHLERSLDILKKFYPS